MKTIKSLYLNDRLFVCVVVCVLAFITSFALGINVLIPKIIFLIFVAVMLTDVLLLFRTKGIQGRRVTPEKLSNGDENEIKIYIENMYLFNVSLRVIDEIPHQFQRRDLSFYLHVPAGDTRILQYFLRPTKRGEYAFGCVNIFVSTPLGLLSRRFKFDGEAQVPVYPSYIQMRKYELLAISNQLVDAGIKKIRRIGHNLEFELIKEYVPGDDFRTINWRASARKTNLMVNHYQDERSQQVYCLIDKGRVMQMPFKGLSLLDYAINASLVISNIAIKKSDRAGILTFQNKIGTLLPASKQGKQMSQILEVLYNQKTAYRESDFSVLYNHVRRKITQRSLLLLFTNFESIFSLQRQLTFLKGLASQHLLVVIFFENTEMKDLLERPAMDTREIYQKAIAEKISHEKKLIVKELRRYGIQALLTTPESLTVNTINKYLELKARGFI